MSYKAVLFDMDGTLLDTLEDLRDSTNRVLRQMGYPERSLEEMRRFVGNGAEKQIRRAVPEGTSEEKIMEVLDGVPRVLSGSLPDQNTGVRRTFGPAERAEGKGHQAGGRVEQAGQRGAEVEP